MSHKNAGPETRAIHEGLPDGSPAVRVPLDASSTFVFPDCAAGKAAFAAVSRGEAVDDLYARFGSPTLTALETKLCAWDDAESAIAFASGMGAICSLVMALCRPGDVVVGSSPLYGGTTGALKNVFGRWGLKHTTLPVRPSPEQIRDGLREAATLGRVRLVLLETPANPTNDLIDLADAAAAAKELFPEEPPIVAVDNTFLGPVYQHPLQHGCDLVVYSATKFLGGHSDLIGGVCLGAEELINPIRKFRNAFGTTMGAYTAWMLIRSLDTVSVRMDRASENTKHLVDAMKGHPAITNITYLGDLEPGSHAAQIYEKQCKGPGALLAVDLGTYEAATKFLDALRVLRLAVSLGGTESLAQHPASMTHQSVPPQERAAAGVTEGMVRMSIGLENSADLIADVRQALDASGE